MTDFIPETPNINEIPTPSQAEGGENPGQQSLPKTTPSQAEGEDFTAEEEEEADKARANAEPEAGHA